MHNFEEKYYKYKNKYKQLKIKNQLGGSLNHPDNKDELITFLGLSKSQEIEYNINGNKISIFKIILNEDTNPDYPVLFALAGMSEKSFKGTSKVILDNLDLLKTKFKELYLVNYVSFTGKQNDACESRDKLKESKDTYKKIYKPELDMNNEIADNLNQIISELKLTNIHLLGKCNGAWVVTLLLLKNSIYKGLYLAVPGIPFNVKILKKLSQDRLKEINFVFGWIKQDGYRFNWNRASFEEKDVYDETMKIIEDNNRIKLKYQSIMHDNGHDEDPKIYHEIFPELLNAIIKSLE
jgi:hypothetical protein